MAALRERCPALCPAVVPAGLSDGEQGVALLGLCKDAAERQALATLLRTRRAKRRACAVTARPVEDDADLRFVATWELDAAAGSYRLRGCDFVCAEVALLLDTAAMLERFSRTDADPKELSRLAQIFAAANKQAGEEAPSGALEARLALQECLNLASACQVVASSLAQNWRVLGIDGEPLQGHSALAIAEAALAAPATAGGRAGGGDSASGKKAKGKKTGTASASATAKREAEDASDDDAASDDAPRSGRDAASAAVAAKAQQRGSSGSAKAKKRQRAPSSS